MDRLQVLRVFVTIVEQGSLSGAAVTLRTSLPTVSRALSSLERELGVRLIARTTRGLTETDGGKLYYQRCRRILDELRSADTAVQAHSKVPSGELRVTAPVTFGRQHVSPYVPEFLENYPRLSFYLSLTDHCESLSEQRLDLAVRVATLQDQNLTAPRLGYVQRTVVGSAAYFRQHPVPAHPSDLSQHNCLHFTHYLRADEWAFQERGQSLGVRVKGNLRTNNQEAVLDAVLAGAGLAVLPLWLVKDAVESGRLRRVLESFERPRRQRGAPRPGRSVHSSTSSRLDIGRRAFCHRSGCRPQRCRRKHRRYVARITVSDSVPSAGRSSSSVPTRMPRADEPSDTRVPGAPQV
jgi:DNA-binding transcriptional LysR family regulator